MGALVVSDPQLKVPVIRRPEYTLSLEQANRRDCFIHCDIHVRWTPKVKEALGRDFAILKDLHGGPFLALHEPGDAKHLKFLRLYGFRRLFTRLVDGRLHEIHTT